MSFVVDLSPSYIWPITVEYCIDGGRFKRVTFDVVFWRLPQERITEILNEAQLLKRAYSHDEPIEGLTSDLELAKEVLAGWDKVNGPDEKPLDFDTHKDEVLSIAGVASQIVTAYTESLTRGKSKN